MDVEQRDRLDPRPALGQLLTPRFKRPMGGGRVSALRFRSATPGSARMVAKPRTVMHL
jgi:hypothetical protein